MGEVIPFRSNYIRMSNENLVVATTKVSFPWLELYDGERVTKVYATIDVEGIPQHLHQYLLVMMRTQKLVIHDTIRGTCDRCQKEEKKGRPWWKWWSR